jgi:putative transposase
MFIFRGLRYRLMPTSGQEKLLRQFAGVCRLVYNVGLEQRRDHWRAYRRLCCSNISFTSQCRELTQLRAEYEWIAEVSQTCQQQALRDLDRAFGNYFAHRAAYPTLPAVGVDRGIANTITLSTGERLSVPARLDVLDHRLRAAQRRLARKRRGSNRCRKQRVRLARLAARRARVRRNWQHQVSRAIARRFGVAVLEDLSIKAMTASAKGTRDEPGRNVRAKSGLNRSILNQGWHAFETILAYKLEERGGEVVKVNSAYTSQSCSSCGIVDARSRENQATFACIGCGFHAHADVNAAINILRRNTASMRVEGEQWSPDEARTSQGRGSPLGNPAVLTAGRC